MHVKIILTLTTLLSLGCGRQVTLDPRVDIKGDVLLRVYFIRHAQAYKNVRQPAGTSPEKLDSLTPKGRREAAALGKFLAGKKVVAVIASPTGRTRQTAKAIAEEVGLRYHQDSSFASLTSGKTSDGKPTSWSWRKEQLKAGRDPRPAGGESFRDGLARAKRAIKQLTSKYQGKAVAIVSHSDICAALLGHAAGTSIYESPQKHGVGTGSASEIVITDTGWFLPQQDYKPAHN